MVLPLAVVLPPLTATNKDSVRPVCSLAQCSQAMGASASFIGRKASKVMLQSAQ
jgi:hypothetical protein